MKMIIDLTRLKLLAELNAFDIWVATNVATEEAPKLYGDISINLPVDILHIPEYPPALVYEDYKHEIWENLTGYQDKYNKKLLTNIRHPHDFLYTILDAAIKLSLEKMSAALHRANECYPALIPLEIIQKLSQSENAA